MNYPKRQSKIMSDLEPNKMLNKALDKKRLVDVVSYHQIHEGENLFYRKCQLNKGIQGEEMDNAEYYWSAWEGMSYKPAPHRHPIYRTEIPRNKKSNWGKHEKRTK